MAYLQLLLFVGGLALLTVGYRRNRRKLMAVAALALLLAGSADELVGGFVAGVRDSILAWAAT